MLRSTKSSAVMRQTETGKYVPCEPQFCKIWTVGSTAGEDPRILIVSWSAGYYRLASPAILPVLVCGSIL